MIALLLGRILFLFSSAFGCAWLWMNDSAALFLSPRNAALLPWTALFLWMLGIAELVALRRGARSERFGARHLAWFAPFALAFLVDPSGLSAAWASARAMPMAPAGDASSNGPSDSVEDSIGAICDSLEPFAAAEPMSASPDTSISSPMPPKSGRSCRALLPVSAAIRRSDGWCALPARAGALCVDTLQDGNWFGRFRAIEESPQEHRGRWIVATGFVIDAESGERWSFLLSRMLVWCCAADASPIGFRVVAGPGAPLPAQGGWYEVAGPVSSVHSRVEGRTVAVLQAATIRAVPPPAQPNVFPFNY